jgi:hypothetical protein
MIRALRMTVGTNLSFDKVEIFEEHERSMVPNFYEDANFVFRTKDGVRSVPYYNISIIELDNIQRSITPDEGVALIRISIAFDLSYGPATIIPHELYDKYNIPIILPVADQLVFTTKEGTYITSDYQINFTHFK